MAKGKNEKKPLGKAMVGTIIRIFWRHACSYPWAMILMFAAVIGATAAEITGAWYSKRLFDTLANKDLSPELAAAVLFSIVVSLFGFVKATEWIFHRFQGFANLYFEANIMRDLENESFENLLGHSYRFFANNFTGSLVRKVRRLSRSFEEITDQVQSNLLPLAVAIIGVLAVLFNRNLLLGAILMIWVFGFILLYYRIARWKLKYDLKKAEKDSETTGILSDALTNIVTIKLFSHYEYEKGRFAKVLGEFTKLRIFTWKVNQITDAIQGGLMLVINLALVLTAVKLWKDGRLSVGDFALIEGVLLVLFHRIWDFGRVVRRIYEAFADASEMAEILDTPYDVKDLPHATPLVVTEGKIEFNRVEFTFHGTRKILDDFTLTLKPGDKVALVGPSGAGKTTVVTLLLRFHDVTSGEILIDGQNISRVTQESLRRHIALVPQEPILFHRTLKDNIRYGKLDATDGEVTEAARKARCHEFISSLPYGYETYVGERGIKLSGGERQRVAIARAILANAPILILDEATSSLDSEVEALIQEALRELMHGKTTIVIAHRLSTVKLMDRIVIIEEGKAAREGTHEDLLQEEGLYKKLWEIQAGGFAPAS